MRATDNDIAMPSWTVPSKLAYALFVAGDARLGEDARPALEAVLEALAKGPPPAVALRAWIAEHGRMGTIPIEALRTQVPGDAFDGSDVGAGERGRLAGATHAMLVAAGEGAGLDARAPWGQLVLAATMASASGGVVYDSGTFRLVPKWILENPLEGFMLGSIKNHVTILTSADAAGARRTTTLGLNKYGLFELELGGVPAAAGETGPLLAGLAQALVDARPPEAGPWEVPATLKVTRRHVAHAFARDVENVAPGSVLLALRERMPGDVAWLVAAPGGEPAEGIDEALRTLGIGELGAEPAFSEAAP